VPSNPGKAIPVVPRNCRRAVDLDNGRAIFSPWADRGARVVAGCESLLAGFERASWKLGGVPEAIRVDDRESTKDFLRSVEGQQKQAMAEGTQ
jgi:hypothetical protein